MLEDVNAVLNSGDVNGLYAEKDMEDIANVCKTDCVQKRL